MSLFTTNSSQSLFYYLVSVLHEKLIFSPFCCVFPCRSISLVLISLRYFELEQAANSAITGSVCCPNSGWFTLLIAVEMLVKSLPEVMIHKRLLEASTSRVFLSCLCMGFHVPPD